MRTLRFQTRLPSGQVEQLNIESERVLIGSGAHCEIRLPEAEARVEHVLIELGPAGVFARALSFEPPPTINNVPFTQAPLPPGAMLGVTGTQIYIEVTEGAGLAGGDGAPEKKKSPVMLIALLLMVPAGGYLVLGEDVATQKEEARPQPPELWGTPVNQCKNAKDRNEAISTARQQSGLADAKRERRPFHVQDGIAAVPLYEAAAACYRAGNDAQSGQLAEDAAKYLRREMNDDFRMRRVRLDHALSVDDFSSAQREVRILLQFVEGKQGDYVTWLSNLERKLKLKIGELKENK